MLSPSNTLNATKTRSSLSSKKTFIVPVELAGGRILRIPYDCKTGWNKGEYDDQKNLTGSKTTSATTAGNGKDVWNLGSSRSSSRPLTSIPRRSSVAGRQSPPLPRYLNKGLGQDRSDDVPKHVRVPRRPPRRRQDRTMREGTSYVRDLLTSTLPLSP